MGKIVLHNKGDSRDRFFTSLAFEFFKHKPLRFDGLESFEQQMFSCKKSVETIEQRDSSQSKPFKLISRAGKAIHNELAQLKMLLS